MNIKDYVKKYNIPLDKLKSDFESDFNSLYEDEKEWLGNLEDKLHLLKNGKNEAALKYVIQKLKGNEPFEESDTDNLSAFVSKISTIVRIANRINNFKEGTEIENDSSLKLYDFFNSVKASIDLQNFNYSLNPNLSNFLPHLYSVIKHCQNPIEYPIYYKYWKNILREVLSKNDDYDSMCVFYRTFPLSNRHLNFATYLGTIGIQIAKNIDTSGISITKDSREYKYLTKDVINIKRYNSILDENLGINLENNMDNYKIVNEFISELKSGKIKAANSIKTLITNDNFENNLNVIDRIFFDNRLKKIDSSNYVDTVSFIKAIHKIKSGEYNDFNIWSAGKTYLKKTNKDLINRHDELNEILGFPDNGNGIYKSFLGEKNLIAFIINKFETDSISDRKSIYDSFRLKMEEVGFQFEKEQKAHRQNRKETELKFIHPQLINKLEEEGYAVTAKKFYIKPLSDEPDCEIGFVTGKTSPLIKEQKFGQPNSFDSSASIENTPAWTNLEGDTALDDLLQSINLYLNTEVNNMKFPLNTILYGPPGTGKTYNTILRAAQIIENREISSYAEALNIFKANLHDRIEFITFHQNYSYEDFIQGLRPETDNKSSLVFDKKDGVFKKIADKALENIKLSEKAPSELSSEAQFNLALEKFQDVVLENEDNYAINDTAYIFEVEEDAFRYTGEKWTNHANGLRMKFSDLKEFYRYGVESRKDIKKLSSISGLAKQHATYYFLVYEQIINYLPKNNNSKEIGNNIRLNKVLRLLNISTEQAVEFLKSKNITIEKKPTVKISKEAYDLLYKEFYSSPVIKVEKQNYVIIIDEINRANISRVFGELITLIESDKRSHGSIPLEARLPSGDSFMVPSNLYIIGTMNTADKSIALLDIALRRRFEFVSMYPKYQIPGQEIYDTEILQKINKQIIKSKGHDFQIGHAYFMGENKDLVQRMNKKVIPLLLEYYMNDEKEVKGILQLAGLKIEEDSWPIRIEGIE